MRRGRYSDHRSDRPSFRTDNHNRSCNIRRTCLRSASFCPPFLPPFSVLLVHASCRYPDFRVVSVIFRQPWWLTQQLNRVSELRVCPASHLSGGEVGARIPGGFRHTRRACRLVARGPRGCSPDNTKLSKPPDTADPDRLREGRLRGGISCRRHPEWRFIFAAPPAARDICRIRLR